MDYKYIEQLLGRYWQCATSLEEEDILRAFFSQKDVPARLQKYRALFAYEQSERKETALGEDFDSRILAMVEKTAPVKARTVTLASRLMPLFKAAAVVAIIVTIGNAAQSAWKDDRPAEDINYADYKDTYSDPAMAYDEVQNALEMVSEGFSQAQRADTVTAARRKGDKDTVTTR